MTKSVVEHLAQILYLFDVEVVLGLELLQVPQPLQHQPVVLALLAHLPDQRTVLLLPLLLLHLLVLHHQLLLQTHRPLSQLAQALLLLPPRSHQLRLQPADLALVLVLLELEVLGVAQQLVLGGVALLAGCCQVLLGGGEFVVEEGDFGHAPLEEGVGLLGGEAGLGEFALEDVEPAGLEAELVGVGGVLLEDAPDAVAVLVLDLPDQLLAAPRVPRQDPERPPPFAGPLLNFPLQLPDLLFLLLHHSLQRFVFALQLSFRLRPLLDLGLEGLLIAFSCLQLVDNFDFKVVFAVGLVKAIHEFLQVLVAVGELVAELVVFGGEEGYLVVGLLADFLYVFEDDLQFAVGDVVGLGGRGDVLGGSEGGADGLAGGRGVGHAGGRAAGVLAPQRLLSLAHYNRQQADQCWPNSLFFVVTNIHHKNANFSPYLYRQAFPSPTNPRDSRLPTTSTSCYHILEKSFSELFLEKRFINRSEGAQQW